jgi:tetratricopeptide (TPR) repeat protein
MGHSILVMAILVGLGGPSADPQRPEDASGDPSAAVLVEAKALFARGDEHFTRGLKHLETHDLARAVGELERAIDLFQAAYALSRRPGLLFNIGQAERHRGRCAQALAAYRSFVALAPPDHEYRADALARIAAMEACLAEPAPTNVTRASDLPTAVSSASRPFWRPSTVVGAGLVAGAVASGFAAGVYAWRAHDLEQQLESRQGLHGLRWDETAAWLDRRGHAARNRAVVLGLAGVALSGAGAAALLVGRRKPSRDDRVSVQLHRDGGLFAGWQRAF